MYWGTQEKKCTALVRVKYWVMVALVVTAMRWKCNEMRCKFEKWSVTNLLSTAVLIKDGKTERLELTEEDSYSFYVGTLYVKRVESDKSGNGNIFLQTVF